MGNSTLAPANMVPGVDRRVMSKVPTPGVRNTATMPTSIKALPRIVKMRNFIAEYSFRPVPQMDISIYMGTSSNSQNRKKSSKSNEQKTPMTAV